MCVGFASVGKTLLRESSPLSIESYAAAAERHETISHPQGSSSRNPWGFNYAAAQFESDCPRGDPGCFAACVCASGRAGDACQLTSAQASLAVDTGLPALVQALRSTRGLGGLGPTVANSPGPGVFARSTCIGGSVNHSSIQGGNAGNGGLACWGALAPMRPGAGGQDAGASGISSAIGAMFERTMRAVLTADASLPARIPSVTTPTSAAAAAAAAAAPYNAATAAAGASPLEVSAAAAASSSSALTSPLRRFVWAERALLNALLVNSKAQAVLSLLRVRVAAGSASAVAVKTSVLAILTDV